MKITDIRASLKRLAERLDNQWAYAQTSIKDDIAVGQVEGRAALWLDRIEGDYYTIMGLPVSRTVQLLAHFV